MAYSPFHADWHDAPTADTPITAAALEYIEAGIVAAASVADAAIPKALADAKGDLIVATGPDTFAKKAVGADDTVPVAAASDGSGIVWQKIGDAQIATTAAIQASKIAGYPGNPAVALLGDGSWGALGAPTGSILAYINAAAPSGWALCDGSAVSRTTFATLFALIGTAYGAGDGSTTFNLPDLRGRVAVGKGTHVDVDTLGDNDGAALADRRPKHNHTMTDPGHVHSVQATSGTFGSGGASGAASAAVNTGSATTGVKAGPQTAGTPVDTPSFVVVQYIIKT